MSDSMLRLFEALPAAILVGERTWEFLLVACLMILMIFGNLTVVLFVAIVGNSQNNHILMLREGCR